MFVYGTHGMNLNVVVCHLEELRVVGLSVLTELDILKLPNFSSF